MVFAFHHAVLKQDEAGVGANHGLEHGGVGVVEGHGEVGGVAEYVELGRAAAGDDERLNAALRLLGVGKQLVDEGHPVAVGLVGVLNDEDELVAAQNLLGVVAVVVPHAEVSDDRLGLVGVHGFHAHVFPGRVGGVLREYLGFAVALHGVLVYGRLLGLHQLADVVAH